MTHCFSGDDDADADDDKLGQAIDLTSPEVPQVITSPEVPQVKREIMNKCTSRGFHVL